MLNFTFKTRKPRQTLAPIEVDNIQVQDVRSRPLSTRFDVFRTSVKRIFTQPERRQIQDVEDVVPASVPADAQHISVQRPTPDVLRVGVVMDTETLKGLESLYEALHDPSLLDARRHQRYNLRPLVISLSVVAETPAPSAPALLEVVTPRCRRSLVLYEIPASSLRSSPEPRLALDYRPRSPLPPSSLSSSSSIVAALESHSQALITVPSRPTTTHTTTTDEPRVMNIAHFEILRFLGEGTSGKVYHVKDRRSKVKVALKVVTKAKKSEYTLSVVIKERDIGVQLADSPWFVNIWASWHDDANLYIAMTAYPTDLDSEMIRCGVIEPGRARFYMAELIIALEELHSRGIIHRDVKSPNILIDRQGHIVLADFGLSKDFEARPTIAERVYQPYWPYLRDENPTSETEHRDPEELYFVAWDYRGSELEMAPEIHLRQPYSFGVDFWSAAVVLYWMLTGRPPFYEDDEDDDDEDDDEDGSEADAKPLAFKIAEDDLYWDPEDNVDEETIDFLERMLTKDPRKRLMISYGIPAHPYFAGVNWTMMEARKVPPPWVPDCEVSHVYEPTSPNFVPGKPFANIDSDPYPEFNYVSEEAARVVDTDSDEDVDDGAKDDSDGDSDGTTVSDVEIMCIGSYEDISFAGYPPSTSTAPTTPDRTESHEGRSLLCGGSSNEGDGDSIQDSWDRTIISPPSTKPVGPGPKRWFHAQDLAKLVPSPSPPAPPVVSAPQLHCFTSAGSTFRAASPSGPKLVEVLCPDSLLVLPCQKQTQIVNGTGLLFKVKVWLSRFWTPKPKQQPVSKRLVLLG